MFVDVEGGGYTCGCGYGFYGDLCQFSSYGFEEDSFMEYSPMDPLQNDIKMTLATSTTDSLLLFQPGLGNEFMALEIRDGNVVFTFTTEGNSLKGLTVSKVSVSLQLVNKINGTNSLLWQLEMPNLVSVEAVRYFRCES